MPTEYYIDASLLVKTDCLFRFNLLHNEGLATTSGSFKMDYGTAFHKFIHAYLSGESILESRKRAFTYFLTKCLKVPEGDFRTIDHLHNSTEAYAKQYPRESDPLKPDSVNGELALELPFLYPLELFFPSEHFLFDLLNRADMKILLTGTVDLKGTYFGEPCLADHKTTSVWNTDSYLEGYRLNVQTMFYSWVWRKAGLSSSWLPVLINGIFLKNPTYKKKDKVTGKLVAVDGWTGCSFKRSNLIDFNDERMERFENWLVGKLVSLIAAHSHSSFPQNFNCCEEVYGPCQFKGMCSLPSNRWSDYKATQFITRKYEPWNFQS